MDLEHQPRAGHQWDADVLRHHPLTTAGGPRPDPVGRVEVGRLVLDTAAAEAGPAGTGLGGVEGLGPRDLGRVEEGYQEVARRLGILPEAGPRDLKGPETVQ